MLKSLSHWSTVAAISSFSLLFIAPPAFAQDDDTAPTLSAEEAVEPTQEELDAVGGLPSNDQPTLETAEPDPAPSHPLSQGTTKADKEEAAPAPTSGDHISVRLGGGLSMISTPAFNDAFSVRDDSPSQGIYGFTADVPASEQQIQLGIGVNAGWALLPSTEIGLNFDVGFAPISGNAGVISVLFGPSVNVEVVDDILVGASAGMGYLGYNFGFTVERENAGDAYMTFKGEDIYFDDEGEARMSMSKGGFVLAPEVSVGYRPVGEVGVVFRAQYLMHTINTDSPWNLTFSETSSSGSSSSSETATTQSATISYEGSYVAGTPLPKAFNFSGLMFLMEVQFTAGL